MASNLENYLSGTNDPSVVATYGTKGQLYVQLGVVGKVVFQKQDDGVSTNWSNIAGSQILAFVSNPGPSGVAGTPMFDVVFVVPGLLATDTILAVTQETAGASGTLALLGWINQVDNGLTGKYVADPGTGSVILVAVKR